MSEAASGRWLHGRRRRCFNPVLPCPPLIVMRRAATEANEASLLPRHDGDDSLTRRFQQQSDAWYGSKRAGCEGEMFSREAAC